MGTSHGYYVCMGTLNGHDALGHHGHNAWRHHMDMMHWDIIYVYGHHVYMYVLLLILSAIIGTQLYYIHIG